MGMASSDVIITVCRPREDNSKNAAHSRFYHEEKPQVRFHHWTFPGFRGATVCVCVVWFEGYRARPRSTPNRSMQSSSAISLVSDRIVRETSCKPWRSRASSTYMQTVATSDAMWHYSFFFGIHQWRNQYSKLGWAINFFPAH
jgi:hypothetical protein